MKGISEFFALFLQFFCEPEIVFISSRLAPCQHAEPHLRTEQSVTKIPLLPNPVGFRLHPRAKGFRGSARKISTTETMKPLTPAASMAGEKTEVGPRARDLNTIRLLQVAGPSLAPPSQQPLQREEGKCLSSASKHASTSHPLGCLL